MGWAMTSLVGGSAAIVDRLLHNAVVINIRSDSYCMRAYHDLGDPKVVVHGRGKTSL